jgi:hypothetical protein
MASDDDDIEDELATLLRWLSSRGETPLRAVMFEPGALQR